MLNLGQIVMEDVEVPEENLLPNVSGLKVKIECEVTLFYKTTTFACCLSRPLFW